MTQTLPVELQKWLAKQHWTVQRAERLQGGYAAAAIYRLEAVSRDGMRRPLVYKQLAQDRTTELTLYAALSTPLSTYMPHVFATLEEAGHMGLLLEDAGLPLKQILQGATLAKRRSLVCGAVRWLATIHVQFQKQCPAWLQAGTLTAYPVSSSVVWGEEALERLLWAAEVGIGGLTRDDVRDVREKAMRIYSRLGEWMRGPATLTHGDPHLENLLVRGETFQLIDWEFTCVTIAQRDLSILVQDVYDDDLQMVAYHAFCDALRSAGWPVDDVDFRVGWLACLFDNTLMMLGWEVYKYQEGHLALCDVETIIGAKLRWLTEAYRELSLIVHLLP